MIKGIVQPRSSVTSIGVESAPTVEVRFSMDCFRKEVTMEVFPTPESPTKTTFFGIVIIVKSCIDGRKG
jgi:hypothetical protein